MFSQHYNIFSWELNTTLVFRNLQLWHGNRIVFYVELSQITTSKSPTRPQKRKKIAMTSFWQFYFPVELKWVGRFHDHGTQATLVEPTEMSASNKVQPHARPTQYIRILTFLQPSYPHAVLAETN